MTVSMENRMKTWIMCMNMVGCLVDMEDMICCTCFAFAISMNDMAIAV